MSFIGLLVLLDEAISAADEKGLRKDWQKDMRGLLQAAVKQNKRAYTKRAAAPAAPKKADATKSPAKQMKDAQRGNTGSGGSEVEGPKGGNRGAGFSGSLGGPGGGGYGGGSSGGGGGGGGYAADIVITGTKQPAKDSKVDLLGDAVKKVKGEQDAAALIKLLNANGSKPAKAIVKALEISSPRRPVFRLHNYSYVTAEIYVEVSRWNGAYDFIVSFELAAGEPAKDLLIHEDVDVDFVFVRPADGEGELDEGDTISIEDFIRRVNEPSNLLSEYHNIIKRNEDGEQLKGMLDTSALQPLYKWVASDFTSFASQEDPHAGLAPSTYQIDDFEKKSNSAELVLYLETEKSMQGYAIVLTCKDNDNSDDAIKIKEVILREGKYEPVSTKVLFADLEADIKQSK